MILAGATGLLSGGAREIAELDDWTLDVDLERELGVAHGALRGHVRRWSQRGLLLMSHPVVTVWLTMSRTDLWSWEATDLRLVGEDAIRLHVRGAPTITRRI